MKIRGQVVNFPETFLIIKGKMVGKEEKRVKLWQYHRKKNCVESEIRIN